MDIHRLVREKSNCDLIERFIIPATVSGNEIFEPWVEQLRFSYILLQRHYVQSVGGKNAVIAFFVIGTKEVQDSFAESISPHIDINQYKGLSKEPNWIWEKYNLVKNNQETEASSAWLAYDTFGPLFFTSQRKLATRTFLDLYLGRENIKRPKENEIRIGDVFTCFESPGKEFKICGINENGTFNVRSEFDVVTEVSIEDLWFMDQYAVYVEPFIIK